MENGGEEQKPLEEVKNDIHSVLKARVAGIKLDKFQQMFRYLTRYSIDITAYGHKQLLQFLQGLPDIVR